MTWERRRYRSHKVWVHVDAEGTPVCDERGLGAIRYRPDDPRTYTVRPEEIAPLAAREASSSGPDEIHVWVRAAEGECVGAGAVLAWRGRERALELFLDEGDPADARAEAVRAALRAIRRPSLPVRVHVRGGEAPARGGEDLARFPDLSFVEAAAEPEDPADRLAERLARRAAVSAPRREGESGAPGVGSA